MSKPRLQASDTLTLLLSLVPYLREHSPVSVDEVANHFGVARKAVVDAINILVMTGVPDREGHIYAGEMFDIDFDLFDEGRGEIDLTNSVAISGTPRLSSFEAASVIAGLHTLMAAEQNDSARDVIGELLRKVSLGLGNENPPIEVVPVAAPKVISAAVEAIRADQQVTISYQGLTSPLQERVIDPVQVTYAGQSWFIHAWCHLRGGPRVFRGDRVTHFAVTGSARCSEHVDAVAETRLFTESDTDIIATLECPTHVLSYLSGYAPQIISVDSASAVVSIRFASTSTAIRLVAAHPGLIRITEPLSLVDDIEAWARNAG